MKNAANALMIDTAFAQIGVSEIVGSEHEPEVMKYYHQIGHKWVKEDELPWCAAFMSWLCFMCKVEMPALKERLRARSFLNWGKSTSRDPKRGDVVVLWRKSPQSASGHVGLLLGFSKDRKRVFLLGGNQGNKVQISSYDAGRILDIRRNEPEFELIETL